MSKKIVRENAFEQKEKETRVKFSPGLSAFEQLGPGALFLWWLTFIAVKRWPGPSCSKAD